MTPHEYVILVDEKDNEIGLMEKHEAHEKALLHRAFSVFVFNNNGELLLQQRANHKYHSGGLWTNTCCSHPRYNETTEDAAHRRLKEEMGFDCALTKQFSFIYHSPFENGLSEHELDFVYTGTYNNNPNINTEEVSDFRWVRLDMLKEDIELNPSNYTIWFQIIFNQYLYRIS